MRRVVMAAATLAGIGLALGALAGTQPGPPPETAAAATLDQGRAVYAAHCAACHGRHLQGQAMWQLDDADSWRRAPALDATGNAWLLGDAALRAIVQSGRKPGAGPGSRSAMPAYASRLSEAELAATLAYIKQHWPVALRVVQASLNPDQAGMPAGASGTAWRFPPICKGAD